MTVIVCISEGGGMLFNKRRQSRDALVILDIAKFVCEKTLFISDFSASLFESSTASVIAVSNPLESADENDAVFIEDRELMPYVDKIQELVIYNWNRTYPADFLLDLKPEESGMTLVSEVEFAGKSHEKVTRLIWRRENNT